MTDIHSHLLFGVDDGAKTLEESIEMLKMGKKLGFNRFILTPHFGKDEFYNKNYNKNFKILLNEVRELNLKVDLLVGNEVYLNENTLGILEKKEYFLINEKYILVEFSPMILPEIGIMMLRKIILKEFKPILAHIERYINFKEKDFILLKKMGVKFQININGKKSRHIVKMLKNRDIDFLASDAHRAKIRGYNLEKELKYIKNMVGEREVARMTSFDKDWEGTLEDEKREGYLVFFINFFTDIFSRNWNK